jgi:hypothetical protein
MADGNPKDTLEAWRALWESTLGVPISDIDVDFFELGGDSLQAVTIATMARDTGIDAPLSAVLRWPTLRQLAAETRAGAS